MMCVTADCWISSVSVWKDIYGLADGAAGIDLVFQGNKLNAAFRQGNRIQLSRYL
jgi:hypothetical protein